MDEGHTVEGVEVLRELLVGYVVRSVEWFMIGMMLMGWLSVWNFSQLHLSGVENMNYDDKGRVVCGIAPSGGTGAVGQLGTDQVPTVGLDIFEPREGRCEDSSAEEEGSEMDEVDKIQDLVESPPFFDDEDSHFGSAE